MQGPSDIRRVPPYGTILIVMLTSCVTLLQFVFPEVLEVLRRDPVALRRGEWWRAVTPLLVHSDGVMQFLPNIVGIAFIGTFLETRFGTRRTLGLYLAGGAVGEVAGYLWQPFGAGASVAHFGLVGGITASMLRRPQSMPALTGQVAVGLPAAVVGNALVGPVFGAILVLLVCLPVGFLLHNSPGSRSVAWGMALFILIAALVLSVLSNIHGPPVVAGTLFGMSWTSKAR